MSAKLSAWALVVFLGALFYWWVPPLVVLALALCVVLAAIRAVKKAEFWQMLPLHVQGGRWW